MKKILSTRVLVKIGVLTTILLVLIICTVWGNSALMVSTVNISSDRIPSTFSNFQIAQVSDLHNAEFGESNTELIELLSEHEPDIIVILNAFIRTPKVQKNKQFHKCYYFERKCKAMLIEKIVYFI